ncbi:NAD-dependent epimerase/dehydratase family protein [Sphingomonas sp. NBWT7]|uniref:NAD-dependent epimerase/dehydratase family protein n=1 Tax=Sphingomonas sp. NBWT7 TaxID=2596913 RepID=UPI001628E2BD|nr:NAD-dependent epimerase/dehydratase family protein [Sphingomonas sp. NBWT7]QNE32708.1 NAD-dependent epimerase/dehydratase family protein [Sphingomonas sp. NBWT7]
MDERCVLIAGASGVIGQSAVARFAADGWRILAVSRRAPDVDAGVAYEHVPLDLTDADACRAAAAGFAGVTHVVYAALYEKPGLYAGWFEADQMETNLAMLRNLMEPLLAAARGLRHVSVFQGTKAYGAHLHSIALPAKEDRPRDPHANFYWLQEDWLRERRAGADWGLTIWRPQVVFGGATGVAMNIVPVLGAYAAICRELGLPLAYPGRAGGVSEAVDADLIADALAWAADAPAAADETYNITNGDVFTWADAWPGIAQAVGLEAAYGAPFALVDLLLEHEAVWDRLVARHGLRATPLRALLGESHHYADLLFGVHAPDHAARAPVLVSTIKLRQAGFGACTDTDAMFAKWLARLAERRIVPPPGA